METPTKFKSTINNIVRMLKETSSDNIALVINRVKINREVKGQALKEVLRQVGENTTVLFVNEEALTKEDHDDVGNSYDHLYSITCDGGGIPILYRITGVETSNRYVLLR